MHINLKESIYKCPSNDCMYPLKCYTFKNNETKELYKYEFCQNECDSDLFKTYTDEFDWITEPSANEMYRTHYSNTKEESSESSIVFNSYTDSQKISQSVNDAEFIENLLEEFDNINQPMDTKLNIVDNTISNNSFDTNLINSSMKCKNKNSDIELCDVSSTPKKLQKSIETVINKFSNNQTIRNIEMQKSNIHKVEKNISKSNKPIRIPKLFNKILTKAPLNLVNQLKGFSMVPGLEITTLVPTKQITNSKLVKLKSNTKKKLLIKVNNKSRKT